MAAYTKLDATSPLTPSELIFLNGEQFVKVRPEWLGGGMKLQLPHTEIRVWNHEQLGQAILGAALLANEQTGTIRLEADYKKVFFGLFDTSTLFAVSEDKVVDWPHFSLESYIHRVLNQKRTKVSSIDIYDWKRTEVSSIIYDWIGRDRSDPWFTAIDRVKRGMEHRGLLKVETVGALFRKRYVFSVAALAEQQSTEPVRQLLEECEQTRLPLWDLLRKQIKKAIKNRTAGP